MALTKVQIDGVEFSDSTDLNVDNGTFVVDSTNNRVGVGTTSPSYSLHVQRGASSGISAQFGRESGSSLFVYNGSTVSYLTSDNSVNDSIGFDTGHALRFFTNDGTEKVRIDANGRLGIGTSSPAWPLDVNGIAKVKQAVLFEATNSTNRWDLYTNTDNTFRFNYNGSGNDEITITSGGLVGIGTTAPLYTLEAASSTDTQFSLTRNTVGRWLLGVTSNDSLAFSEEGVGERARIDSSGRLLVGTSTASTANVGQYARINVTGNSSNSASSGIVTLCRGETSSNIATNEDLGVIVFGDTQAGEYAKIICTADGVAGSGDYPGRLVFSTTADGASSPTERMRISADGAIRLNTTATNVYDKNTNSPGVIIQSNGFFEAARYQADVAAFNREGNDGIIIGLWQDGTQEGNISVSGTTVSYNGAHLSRWTQLTGGTERTEILRGTVLSNLDEMCEWGDEDNEQLNRMKVSDVEGDKNVAGVFQAWDDDDDTYTNDFYCAMTGDFIIRIGAGVTVERGDLLMSAGDGTAKPQDDDIIRSKTVAKVTSTNVSCTYEDGSYCVPCVLMAC